MADDKRGGSKQKERQHASLKGKVVLVVSAAQDLGYELAVSLSKHGCRIVLAGSLYLVHPVSNQIRDLARESQVRLNSSPPLSFLLYRSALPSDVILLQLQCACN